MISNDIYVISSRIKNILAREDIALSPAGEILVNTTALFLKNLYDFSENLNPVQRFQLRDIISSGEDMPRYIINLISPKPEPKEENESEEVS